MTAIEVECQKSSVRYVPPVLISFLFLSFSDRSFGHVGAFDFLSDDDDDDLDDEDDDDDEDINLQEILNAVSDDGEDDDDEEEEENNGEDNDDDDDENVEEDEEGKGLKSCFFFLRTRVSFHDHFDSVSDEDDNNDGSNDSQGSWEDMEREEVIG